MGVLLAIVLTSPVPSPGAAVLQPPDLSRWVAQSPDPAEEEQLEKDMDRGREHLGHDDPKAPKKPANTEPEKLEQDMDRARQHLGHDHKDDDHAGHDHPPGEHPASEDSGIERYAPDADPGARADDYYEAPRQKKKRKRKKRRRKKPRYFPDWYERPTRAEHTSTYYKTWTFIDWGLMGATAIASLSFGVVSIVEATIGYKDGPLTAQERNPGGVFDPADPDFHAKRLRKADYQNAALVTGLASIALAATSVLLGWRAASNWSFYKDLREQEQTELHLYHSRVGIRR